VSPAAAQEASPARSAAGAGRIRSLDVFRGLTVAVMILVNTPGEPRAVFPLLEHVAWDGWAVAETVFPVFLWIVGASIPLSLARGLRDGVPRRTLLARAGRRSALLFLIGLVLNAIPRVIPMLDSSALATLRIPGTLQRIAVCAFLATLLFLWTRAAAQAFAILALLAVYSALMLVVPVPGFGPGLLEPQGNFAWWADRLVLGDHSKARYAFDPNGVVGTLSALASTLFGLLAGHALLRRREPGPLAASFFFAGNLLLVAGALIARRMPINESLWSTSYCVFMAGFAFCSYAAVVWAMDRWPAARWPRPFEAFGRNALLLFVATHVASSLLAAKGFPKGDRAWVSIRGHLFEWLGVVAPPRLASLLYALLFVLLAYGAAEALFRRRIFVTL
jgi:predicted acyltransferase